MRLETARKGSQRRCLEARKAKGEQSATELRGADIDACVALGLPQRELFITADLFDDKNFGVVLKNIEGLSYPIPRLEPGSFLPRALRAVQVFPRALRAVGAPVPVLAHVQ